MHGPMNIKNTEYFGPLDELAYCDRQQDTKYSNNRGQERNISLRSFTFSFVWQWH